MSQPTTDPPAASEAASLKRFRLLLCVAGVVYPLWALFLRYDAPASDPDITGRVIIGAAALAIALLSRVSAWVRRHLEAVCLVLAMVIAAHIMWSVFKGHLAYNDVNGYVLAMVGIAAALETRRALLTFILFAGGLLFLPFEDGQVTAGFFRSSTLIVLAMGYVALQDKLMLFTALKRANRELARDITEQRHLRSELLAREAHSLAVIDAIPGPVAWVGRDLNYLGVNRVLSDLHGIPPAAFVGKPYGFMHDPGVEASRLIIQDLFAGGAAQINREVTVDEGDQRVFMFSGTRYQDDREVILIALDITDQKRAERAVQDHQDLLSQVLDHIPHGIYVKDATADFRYVIWNRNMEHLSGRARADVLGRTDRDILAGQEAVRQRRLDAYVLANGVPLDVPEEELQPGHRAFPAHTVRVPVLSANGATRMVLGVVEDITETKEREALIRDQQAQLMHASKMSTLGEMSGGVAHEINNPLTVIMGFAQRLNALTTTQTANWDELKRCADRITSMTERIARIIRGLRTFAREASADPFENLSVARLVTDTLELCQQRFQNHGIHILVSPLSETLELEGRPVQLSQVLLNLLHNSFDAVQCLEEKWVRIDVEDEGDRVRVTVTDAGNGIPADIAAKVLHPFFTTKGVGQGTGLGLSISRGIVESHHGNLYYDPSAANTRFVVDLPKHQEAKRAA